MILVNVSVLGIQKHNQKCKVLNYNEILKVTRKVDSQYEKISLMILQIISKIMQVISTKHQVLRLFFPYQFFRRLLVLLGSPPCLAVSTGLDSV